MTPVQRFFERTPEAVASEPALTAWLDEAFRRCAEHCPSFTGGLGDFASNLGERYADAAARAAIPDLALEDLFVAWCTARGVPEAVAQFERAYLAPACAAVRSADPAELAQSVRVRLLVGSTEDPPKIGKYTGRGPLVAWVRMTATRIAIDLARKHGTEERAVNELSYTKAPIDPELDYLKARYAEPFRQALEKALLQLSERDASLIKLAYLEDVSPSAMARTHGVSTRTVQRWIAEAREAVLDGARRILSESLNVNQSELEGLMRLAQSQMKVTLERVLGR